MAKLMLHACCGPCSLEPIRLLQQEGFEIVICWSNDNIAPVSEHDLRLDTLKSWAQEIGVEVIEAPVSRDRWERGAGRFAFDREKRCQACYAQRLEKTCKLAKELGFAYISTTLAVSPYQLFDVCSDTLEHLAHAYGLTPVIRDFRPYYADATKRSRDLGMYRQNYCGCRFSAAEAQLERQLAKRTHQKEKHAH